MADFGWAFVKGGIVTGSAPPSGAVQFNNGSNGFGASGDLVFVSGSTSQLSLTGNLDVNGEITVEGLANFNSNVNFAENISLPSGKRVYFDGTLSNIGEGPFIYAPNSTSLNVDGDEILGIYVDDRFVVNAGSGGNKFTVKNSSITSSVDTRIDGDLTVSGTINANELNINVENRDVINISVTGSTKFGDSSDDTHVFTGSMYVGTSVSSSTLYGTVISASAMNLTGIQAGTPPNTSSYLALDSNYNLVITSAAGGGSSSGVIGDAEDGDYTDGLFTDFLASTPIGTAIDKFNEILKIIVPGPAPSVDRINYTNTAGIETKLSFEDQVDAPTDYVDVGTTGSFSSNVLIDEQYAVTTSGEDFRLGVYDGNQEITGVINFNVAEQFKTSELNYSNNAFGNAESGSLKLYLNGVELHSTNLASTTGTGNPNTGSASDLNSSGSGFFDISISASATDQNGSTYDIFQHRTAKYVIDPQDQNKGWNYAKVEHEYGSITYVTNFVQWFNDTDASTQQMTISNQAVAFTGNGSKYLSGVQYFRSASLVYTADVENFYKYTYPTGNVLTFNTSSNLDNISPSGAAPTDGTDLYNKVFQITASTETNDDTMLNDSTTISFNLSHPLKTDLATTGSVVTNQILIYNVDTANSNTDENFDLENFRLINSLYNNQNEVTASEYAWNSENHMTSSGASGHTDGLLMYNGALRAPKRGANRGRFNTLTNGPAGNPNYSSVSGTRTFFRKIQNTGSAVRDLKIISTKNTLYNNTSLTTDNAKFSIKLPGSSAWLDISQPFSYGNISVDGDGALISGADDNDNAGVSDSGNSVHCITFGTAEVANNDYVVIKIEADTSWSGYINRLQFQLGASDDDDAITPDSIADLNLEDTAGVEAKLSFGSSNRISGYSLVSTKGNLTAVDSNGVFTDDEDVTRGVFSAFEVMGGTINPTASALRDGTNYTFYNGYTGSLVLDVNGTEFGAIDLGASRSLSSSIVSDTGLSVSAVGNSETTDGIPDYTLDYRTGTYSIGTADQRLGWNYARVIHRVGGVDTTTNYVRWVVDTSSSIDTSISSPTLTNFGHTDVYYQSGIGYFASNPTASFSFSGSNFYNNVYQNGTAISFPTLNSASVGSITGSGTGLTTLTVSGNEMDMPALDNSADCELTEIVVTASVTYTGGTSISGGLGIFTARNSGLQSTIIHPLKTNRTTTLAEKTAFMRYSGSIGSTTLETDEYFGLETYRIVSGNYVNQSDITSSSNTWNSQTHMNGGGSHDDGMVTSNGYLISPLKIGNAGDTQNTEDGGSLQAPSGNPDYSNLTEDVRTYYRQFKYTGATTVSSFTANIKGDATLVAKSGTYSGSLGANKNCHIEFKVSYDPNFPSPDDNSTVWCDMAKIADSGDPTLQSSGQDGAGIRSGGLTGEDQTIDDPSGLDLNLTLGSSRVKQNQYFVVKISAHKNWTGYIKQLNFDLT